MNEQWPEFGIEFDTEEGNFGFTIYARDFDHAEERLKAIKENGRVVGQLMMSIPAGEDPDRMDPNPEEDDG